MLWRVPVLIALLLSASHAATKKIVYENAQYRVYRDTSLSFEFYDSASVPTANIARHLNLIDAMLVVLDATGCPCRSVQAHKGKGVTDVELQLDRYISDTTYFLHGRQDVTFGQHGLINSYTNAEKCSRDSLFTAKCPADFAINSQKEAFEAARTFLSKLLKIHNVKDDVAGYDSVIVNEKEQNIEVELLSTRKNYIVDTRKAEFQIDRRTGNIKLFRGQLYSKYDLSYRPSVSKEIALTTLNTEIEKAYNPPKLIVIASLGVTFNHWAWTFFLCYTENCEEGARTVSIDSETGAVIHSMID
jgi:hypothetical protein